MGKKISNSTWCCKNIDDALALVQSNGYIEWDVNTLPFSLNLRRMTYVRDFIKDNGEVRFHLPHAFWDIGVGDKSILENSFGYYCRLFKMMEFLNTQYAVVHIGAATESDEDIALENLFKLARCANDNGVKLCVENLIHGLSSNMSFLKKCLEIPYINMCLDTGHAECVYREKGEEVFQWIFSFRDKILHAHVYHYEDEHMNHIPFTEETIKGYKWLEILRDSPCEWYTMELDLQKEQEEQKYLIKNFMGL